MLFSMARTTSSHQLILLTLAVALAGGLLLLPKVIVKPKEGKGELTSDAARTANRDGGSETNGSKAVASSGEQPTVTASPSAEMPHQEANAGQRRELNQLLGRYRAERDPVARLRIASDLAKQYKAVSKFDSAGYYYEQVALARPGEQAWKRAADEYFEALSFATTQERVNLLNGKTRELYEKVLKNNPENLDAKTNLGMAYMATENPLQGVKLLREVLVANVPLAQEEAAIRLHRMLKAAFGLGQPPAAAPEPDARFEESKYEGPGP